MRAFSVLLMFALMTSVILGLPFLSFPIEATTIAATMDVKTDTLNLKMKGKWITAYIELPEPYKVSEINVSTVRLEIIPAELHPTEIGDYDGDNIPDLMVKFDASNVINYIWSKVYHIAPIKEGFIELTIRGQLYHGKTFAGSDKIRIIHIET